MSAILKDVINFLFPDNNQLRDDVDRPMTALDWFFALCEECGEELAEPADDALNLCPACRARGTHIG